jgi:putative hemolysin
MATTSRKCYILSIVLPDSFPLLPVVVLLFMSAFFSGTETALFSLSRFQLRQLRQDNASRFEQVRYLLDRPAALVATALLGNELANVLLSHLTTRFYQGFHLQTWMVTIINLVTVIPVTLIFGEITPKVIGAKANLSFLSICLNPFWWFYRISFPMRFLIEHAVNFLTRPIRGRKPLEEEVVKEEDIRLLLDEGKKKGTIHSVERDIIENLFDIDDDKAIELATPLQDCMTVKPDDTPKAVIESLKRRFHARIPVMGEQPDRVVGILYAKDLLNYISRDEKEMTVRDLMKDPLIVAPGMKVEVLFRRFRQMKRHIAIVEDKFGRCLGVITMEDLLEQMFGELWEAH